MDEIQKLIDINDDQSAFEYLKDFDKKVMRKIACRLIYKGVEDNAFIAQITSSLVAEIEELRSSYLTVEEAMVELDLSENRLRKYIRRGLTTMHDGKIPRYAVVLMKDPVFAFIMQWEYQQNKIENQTKEVRVKDIQRRIIEFEEENGGNFDELFGHLTDEQIEEMDESMDLDLMMWKELSQELQKYEGR